MAFVYLRKKHFALRWWREVLQARWRLWWSRWRFEPRVIDKRIEGEPCRFLLANPTGQAWYGRTREHASLELRFVRENMLRPGMTVFEIGGHHGHDTIVLARWVGPQGRVIVFEPVPENAAVIRSNCELNSLDNVEVVEAAVGAEMGTGRISEHSNGKIVAGDGSGIAITMTSLDRFCSERGIFPDLLKIDVEGYELDVLEGAPQVLRRRPQLQLELHADQLPDFGRKPEDVWSYIDPDGYGLWVQRHDLEAPRQATDTHLPPGRIHLYFVAPDRDSMAPGEQPVA